MEVPRWRSFRRIEVIRVRGGDVPENMQFLPKKKDLRKVPFGGGYRRGLADSRSWAAGAG
jgi:hypothetical protein